MANATSFQVEQNRASGASQPSRRYEPVPLWHDIQDIKSEAEQIDDGELVLLVGMVELLVEERSPTSVPPTARRCRLPPIRPAELGPNRAGQPAA